jgi:Asp-tRNA(Asn)/Glu-tRNA(Gln) amidotransferase A subunit family amidase
MGADRIPLLAFGAVALRDRLASGALRAEDLASACLDRIAAEEPRVQAWAWLDGDHVMAQARALDARRQSGAPIGPLHGLPVGVKDIIDVKGMPTGCGLPVMEGRAATRDAAAVARLRAAGAIVMGKTVTTEGAFLHPGKTRNPHNPGHTPGGSSSGSAAAVAAGMVPLAIGTQTGGSVIRPAAYCGIVGFKPTFGAISRAGILMQSPTLDTVGVFARSVEDAALLAEALAGHDPEDPATAPVPAPRLLSVAQSPAPVPPMFAFLRLPGHDDASDDMRAAMEEIVGLLGGQCFEAPLPAPLDQAAAMRERINFAEMAHHYAALAVRGGTTLSEVLRSTMDAGKAVSATDYLAAMDWPGRVVAALAPVLDRCDAILCPSAPSAAPEGLASTGSAIFNGVWTLAGMPAVTLPLFQAGDGLPMGLQLVGRRGDDARLLRTARWLTEFAAAQQSQGEQP